MLIVGLGNPGSKYDGTYHNLGFSALDAIAERLGVSVDRKGDGALFCKTYVGGDKVVLAKPQTFMNLSGTSVNLLLGSNGFKPEQCVILYDDVEIPVGTLRARAGGSAGTHNGMRSIIGEIGTSEFPRIRIGIKDPEVNIPIINYVLADIRKEDYPLFADACGRAADAAIRFAKGETIENVMNAFNQ